MVACQSSVALMAYCLTILTTDTVSSGSFGGDLGDVSFPNPLSRIPSEIPEEGQKVLIANWTSPLYLVFCLGAVHVYFYPPPAMPQVQLLQLEIRLKAATAREFRPTKLVQFPSSLKPVDPAKTGKLVRVDLADVGFNCAEDCKGYTAEVVGLNFNDTYHCDCRASSTQAGCLYFPNGTINSWLPEINCKLPKALADYARSSAAGANCTKPPPTCTVCVPKVVGLVVAFLAVAFVGAVICWLLAPVLRHCLQCPAEESVYKILRRDRLISSILQARDGSEFEDRQVLIFEAQI